jgi:hypothetical protein
MDIVYQLPFPDEICSKILLYAFRSSYTDLPEEIFKRALPPDIYQKLVEKGGIVKDAQGHITKVCVWDDQDEQLIDDAEKKSIQFDIQVLQGFQHLIQIDLYDTCVFGDIQVMQGLQNLVVFNLNYTGVFGDIQDLQCLQNLTEFYLSKTLVTGDIQVLQGLPHLSAFNIESTGVFGDIQFLQGLQYLIQVDLGNTRVFGDIINLNSMLNLTGIYLCDTRVFGDEEAFHEYRKNADLKECSIYL